MQKGLISCDSAWNIFWNVWFCLEFIDMWHVKQHRFFFLETWEHRRPKLSLLGVSSLFANVQLVKRDIVTAVTYYYITTESQKKNEW